ncbi:MAG: sugar phosphate isomerase/epimerase family protein [Planctomycetota bacterium]
MIHDLTRRSFVKTTGVMLTTSPLMAAERAVPATSPRAIRKAVKLGMVSDGTTVAEKFQLLRDLGYDGVEVSRPSSLPISALIEARDQTGLPIHGVVNSQHWGQPLSHPDAAVRDAGRTALEQALRDCKTLGGSTVLLVPAVVNKEISYFDAYTRSQTEIRRVLPLAEELGVRIALENVWNNFLLSPMEAARYVDEFESSWIGWYFDVGNIVAYGWPEQWVRILGSRIIKLDAKEYSRTKQNEEGRWRGFDVKLLDGDCDWSAVMTALDEIGFAGWMTAELSGGDRTWLADVAARMDRIIAIDAAKERTAP